MTDKVNVEKALGMGRVATGGILAVFSSRVVSKIISLIGSVILVRLLVSPVNFGILSLATVLPGLTMLGDVTGVYSALQKDIAAFKSNKDGVKVWSSFWTVIIIKTISGVLLSSLAFVLSYPVAVLLGKPEIVPYFQIASFLPLVWVLQNSGKALIAMDRAKHYALLDILDEIFLSSSPIIPVLLGFGTYGAMVGLVVGNLLFLFATIFVLLRSIYDIVPSAQRQIEFKKTFTRVIRWGLPLGVSNSFSSFTGQLINLIIARFVNLGVYGLYSVASSAVSFVGYVDDAIGSVAFPTFSKLEAKEEPETLHAIFRYAVKFSTAVVVPVSLFAAIFSRSIVTILFGEQYSTAGPYLTILSLAFLAYGLGSGLISSMLQSQGYTKFLGALAILYTSIQVIVAALVVPTMGFIPYLIASLFVFIPTFLLKVRKARSTLGITPPLKIVAPVYISALVSVVPASLFLVLGLPEIITIIIGAIILLSVYLVTLVLVKGLTISDLHLARNILSTQPLVGGIISRFLSMLEMIAKITS